MDGRKDTAVEALLEHLIEHGPGDIATVFGRAFELAMRIERERFLRAGPYERTAERQGYANGYKPKRIDTPAGTVTEAFAWSGSAIFGGAALGNVVAGFVVEHVGVREALALPALSGLVGLVSTLTTRRALASLGSRARVLAVSRFPDFLPLMRPGIGRFAPHVAGIEAALLDDPGLDNRLAGCDVAVYATGAEGVLGRLPRGVAASGDLGVDQIV